MAKKATKTRPRAAARPKAATASTAMVLSKKDINRVRQELVDRVAASASAEVAGPTGVLGEDAIIGQVGRFEVRLTPEEEKVLDEPVNIEHVAIKPTGEPYIPHERYTGWFNRAFGRLGWAIVPCAKPRVGDNTVIVPYVLYIHGKPAAFAWGEQAYSVKNKRQSLGDAVEATVASALRRFAKRLGVGLELWRREWLDDFITRRAIAVVTDEGVRWRLTNQRALPGEQRPAERGYQRREEYGGGGGDEHRRDEGGHRPPAGHDGNGGATISDRQHKRLWAIASSAGRDTNEVKAWVKGRFNLQHTRELLRKDYDYVCEQLETPGALPGGR